MGILAHKNNARAQGHQHAEAFSWMTYGTKPGVQFIRLRIWNSRDGVTPFVTYSTEYGVELQHVNYDEDRYDPTYKPVKGDLIWRSWTEEEAIAVGQIQFRSLEEEQKAIKDLTDEEFEASQSFNDLGRLNSIIEAGEQAYINEVVEALFKTGQPRLALVLEDWK